MTYVELALDFEAHAEQALLAPSDHRLRGVMLPLRTRGQVLKMALDALQPDLQARDLLQGKEVWMAKSLLLLGGFKCVKRVVCPLFARPDAMVFLMRQPEAHCCALRTRGGKTCSYWITSPRQDQGCSPCGPFSACRAGGCNATGKGQEAVAQAAWHRRCGWPCVHDTGPRLVPPACSRAPSTTASGLKKGTA